MICTYPGENAACSQEMAVTTIPPTTPTTIQLSGQGEGQNFPNAVASLPASITFSVQQSGNAAVQGQFEVIVHLPSGNFFTKMGTLDSVQISGSTSLECIGALLIDEQFRYYELVQAIRSIQPLDISS